MPDKDLSIEVQRYYIVELVQVLSLKNSSSHIPPSFICRQRNVRDTLEEMEKIVSQMTWFILVCQEARRTSLDKKR